MAKLLWRGKTETGFGRDAGLRLEARVLSLFWRLVAPLPPRRAAALGRRLLGTLGPKSGKHRHVLANLRIVHPELSDPELRRRGRQVWENLGAALAEYAILEKIVDGARPRVEIVCNNRDADFLNAREPCIFVAAHLGNWNMSLYAIRKLGFPVDVVYSPLSNPYLNVMVQDRLEVLDSGFITKQNAARPLYKALTSGRSVGLHVDVRVDGGETFPFIGLPATTTTAPAWLSQKTGCAIVPLHTRRLDDDRFRVTVYPALEPVSRDLPRDEAIRQTTSEMNRVIGELVASNSSQWMCTKRRWPKALMQSRGAYPGRSDD